MRAVFIAAIALSILVAGKASAGTDLTSAPLKAGAGGVVCACQNLTPNPLDLDFLIRSGSSINVCGGRTADAFGLADCSVATSVLRTCSVRRSDGKSLSVKQVRCTFSALDASGDPIVMVPVDAKVKL